MYRRYIAISLKEYFQQFFFQKQLFVILFISFNIDVLVFLRRGNSIYMS